MNLRKFEEKKVQNLNLILMFVISWQSEPVALDNLVTCYIAVLTTILPSQDLQYLTKSLSHHMT